MRLPFFAAARTVPTAFLDPATGTALPLAARRYTADRGTKRAPALSDHLDAAQRAGMARLFVAGPIPAAWHNRPPGKGWRVGPRGHFADSDEPRLSFVSDTGHAVEIRAASAWFGPDVTAAQAAGSWNTLDAALRGAFRKDAGDAALLLASPSATGRQLLAALRVDLPEPLDHDTAAFLRATSPQHRIEAVGACYDGCDEHLTADSTPRIGAYLDARFAYAALCRELGTGTPTRLSAKACAARLAAAPYGRARYLVDFRVPWGWEGPGLLMARHPDGRHWHAPNRPGVTGRTWADAAEVDLALTSGWAIVPVEGMAWGTTARPLDTWIRRLAGAWSAAQLADQPRVAHALRAIVLHTIGSFHSTGREQAHLVASSLEVPAAGVTGRRDHPDGSVTFYTREPITGPAAAFARPEWSSQIWARAHVRLAASPDGGGFLNIPTTWALFGDAIYAPLAAIPDQLISSNPLIGHYRLKGITAGPIDPPRSVADLTRLRAALDPAGKVPA